MQRGYIALLAVLIIGAASLAIATALLVTATDSQRSTLAAQQSAQARSLAASCAEEALQLLHDNSNFTGTNNLTFGAGSCTYTVTNPGGTTRLIAASGTVSSTSRKIQVNVTVGVTTLSVASWQEIGGTASTIAHVQSNGLSDNASLATIAQSFASNVTAGNFIVASISWQPVGGLTSVTCTDNQGNSYATVNVWNDATQVRALAICYAPNAKAGATTVTATIGNGAVAMPFRRIIISEYSGVATIAPLEANTGVGGAVATTATDAVTSGAVTTALNGDLIYGAVKDTTSTTTIAAGTGFTQRFSLNGKDMAVQDLQQSVAGSIASTQTFGATHRYDAGMAVFRAQPQ